MVNDDGNGEFRSYSDSGTFIVIAMNGKNVLNVLE